MYNMNIRKTLTLITSLSFLCSGEAAVSIDSAPLKPRLVVMTDIGDCNVEPDDMESAVRLMSYADCFEIEAIMTTVGWNCDPYPEEWVENLNKVVDAYSKDVKNLMRRSSQATFLPLEKESIKQEIGYWPSVEYIRSRVMAGSHKAGIGVIGENNNTPGSDFLIKLADEDDDRPIWVATWGSGNTLAQAIWKVKQTRSKEQLKAFLNKFRIYTITDQDMVYGMRMNRAYSSHMWMRREFKDDLKFIWDENTWQLQCELGKRNWNRHETLIQNNGELGKVYPKYKWGVEGDTPSFLYIMPNGLSDPEDPSQANWGGCHTYGISPDSITYSWSSWKEPYKSITEGYKSRFYPDELNDFIARIQWAKDGKGNTNPVVFINGKHSVVPITLKAKAGKELSLDASKSFDKEGDDLKFQWWQQPEAGTYKSLLKLDNGDSAKVKISIPDDAKGKKIHIVCEVHDDSKYNLVSYMRVIVDVK